MPGAAGWAEVQPGLRVTRLWDRHAFLAALAPGTRFAPHGHPWTEHCQVRAGHMEVDGPICRPGSLGRPEGLLVRRAD